MILLDTSALVRSLTGQRTALPHFEALIERGERLRLPALVLYEWQRGPRTPEQLAVQEALMPSEEVLPFDHAAARLAADIYAQLERPPGRSIDIAIAATAIKAEAALWTFNTKSFADVPQLQLLQP